MSEDKAKPDGRIKGALDSAAALAKAVPVYQDALQPLAKETGKALETIGKAINAALAPIAALVWGYEKIKEFIEKTVAEKLKDVPEGRIQTPSPSVAGPALEALKYSGHEETLRDMYANLIANSLDKETAENAHPAFVDIIKNLCPDEARIMRLFATNPEHPVVEIQLHMTKGGYEVLGRNVSEIHVDAGCEHAHLVPNYLNNLCRLGLLAIPAMVRFLGDEAYDRIVNDPEVLKIQKQHENTEAEVRLDKRKIELTDLGKQFVRACVIDKRVHSEPHGA